jgi:hypothetical protein
MKSGHLEEPRQHGRLSLCVVDGLQAAELGFRATGQNSIDVSQQ